MTNYNDRLDEIVSKLARDTTLADRVASIATTASSVNNASERYEWSLVEAKQALVDWHNKQVLEIIGEDEPPEGLTSWYDGIERDSRHREGRNMLREWQRNKLKEAK